MWAYVASPLAPQHECTGIECACGDVCLYNMCTQGLSAGGGTPGRSQPACRSPCRRGSNTHPTRHQGTPRPANEQRDPGGSVRRYWKGLVHPASRARARQVSPPPLPEFFLLRQQLPSCGGQRSVRGAAARRRWRVRRRQAAGGGSAEAVRRQCGECGGGGGGGGGT